MTVLNSDEVQTGGTPSTEVLQSPRGLLSSQRLILSDQRLEKVSKDRDANYRQRLVASIVASILLNFFFLWVIFSFNFAQMAWFGQKSKPRLVKEIPHLVLVERHPTPRPRTFLETDASQAVKEAPKDATFYSEHNTVATQTAPSEIKSADVPKADGKNTKTMATETVHLAKPSPPSLSSPPSQPVQAKSTVTEPQQPTPPASEKQAIREPPKVGDYALLKTTPPVIKPMPLEKAPLPSTPPISPQVSSSTPTTPHDAALPVSPSQAVPMPPNNREVLTAMSKLDGGINRVGKTLAFNSAESPSSNDSSKGRRSIISRMFGSYCRGKRETGSLSFMKKS